jgi:tetratricopeptide (TPR) repeat protein
MQYNARDAGLRFFLIDSPLNLLPKRETRRIILGVLLVLLLGVVLYSHILNSPFVFDDSRAIKENESIKSFSHALGDVANTRYLTDLSFAINYTVGGLNPFGYHLANNIIHIINGLLVFYFVLLLFTTPFFKSKKKDLSHAYLPTAFFVSLIFLVHPIQTQAVTYIVQRSTSMATMFCLLSLIFYITWRVQRNEKRGRLKIMFLYLFSIIFAVCAMKTKEISFTLPVIIILSELLFFTEKSGRHGNPSLLRRLSYLLPLLLTMLIIPLSIMNFNAPIESIAQDLDLHSRETVDISRKDYLFTQFPVIMTYLRLLMFPVNQNLDHAYPVYSSFFQLPVWLSFIVLSLILSLSLFLLYRTRVSDRSSSSFNIHSRLIAFGMLWFFITLSVESSVIPIRDVIVEHRLYLPSIGFVIAAVLFIQSFIPHKAIKIVVMCALIVSLSVLTYSRNSVWKDPQTLWQDVIAKTPGSARAYNNLGVAYKNSGAFDKAIEQFEKSIQSDRQYIAVYFNLGDIFYRQGKYKNAVQMLEYALELNPASQLHLDILNKLGRTYSAMGQTDNAIAVFQKAITVLPSAIAPYNNLAVQYIKVGEYNQAIETLSKAIAIREEPYLLSNLTIAYERKNTGSAGRGIR